MTQGFHSYGYGLRLPSPHGAAASTPLAGGYIHLASAAPSFFERKNGYGRHASDLASLSSGLPAGLVYDIAPNRIPAKFGMHGLGLDDQTKRLVISAPSIAGGVLTAGGSASLAATAWGLAAIPIIGAVVAGVTLGLSFLLNRKGPAQKVATTKIVDSIENGWTGTDGIYHPGLKDNLIGYMQGPRTVSSQVQALANFDAAWAYVVSHCNTAEMGDPGQRCIQDRQAGACKWTRGAGDPMEQYDGVQPGQCWNWAVGYRDPIARDIPNPDPTVTTEAVSAIDSVVQSLGLNSAGSSNTYLLMGGAVILLAAIMGGK